VNTRKLVIVGALAAAAVAMPLAVAGSANAATTPKSTDPVDCRILVTPETTTTSTDVDQSWYEGSFTITEPAGAIDQRENLWTHTFNYKAGLDMTFTGEGTVSGSDSNGPMTLTENVTGQEFPGPDGSWAGDDNEISLHIVRQDGRTYDLDHAPLNTVTNAVTAPEVSWPIQMVVSNLLDDRHLVHSYKDTTVTVPAVYRAPVNHGDYGAAMGGSVDAAHSQCGMPIQAQKNGKA